jgi:hypothetical protein
MTKYNARKTTVDGYTFDSKAEAARYSELRLLEQAGEIHGLVVHPRFELQPAFDRGGRRERAICYIADFQYNMEPGITIVEDVKGGKATQTEVFRLKRKMWEYQHRHDGRIVLRVVER